MTTAKEILTLIENVDPSDSDALNEIDARVWCFKNNKNYNYYEPYRNDETGRTQWIVITTREKHTKQEKAMNAEFYTRSRDARRSITPNDFIYVPTVLDNGLIVGSNQHGDFETPPFEDEDRPELHAIVQAIEWERENEHNNS